MGRAEVQKNWSGVVFHLLIYFAHQEDLVKRVLFGDETFGLWKYLSDREKQKIDATLKSVS